MKVLIVNTSEPSLRSEIWGWGYEDSDLFKEGEPIGLTPSPQMGWKALENPDPFWSPKTVLEALYRGWKLLGPPQCENTRPNYSEDTEESWAWWLVKD
jgi:hypothetical protein